MLQQLNSIPGAIVAQNLQLPSRSFS